ncbi:MAG TPA: hypothetical protein VF221_11365 [Chloroflexota bacterium]
MLLLECFPVEDVFEAAWTPAVAVEDEAELLLALLPWPWCRATAATHWPWFLNAPWPLVLLELEALDVLLVCPFGQLWAAATTAEPLPPDGPDVPLDMLVELELVVTCVLPLLPWAALLPFPCPLPFAPTCGASANAQATQTINIPIRFTSTPPSLDVITYDGRTSETLRSDQLGSTAHPVARSDS